MMPRPSRVALHKVVEVERRLAEELVGALVLQHQQLPLDRPDGGGRDVAVFARDLLEVLGAVEQQRAQVLQVEDRPLVVVRDPESDVEHAFLRVVEFEQPGQ